MIKSILAVVTSVILTGCSVIPTENPVNQSSYLLENIPEFSGEPYVVINDNQPDFDFNSLTTEPFENYSELDSLGRCGVATANICKEIMPTQSRGDISSVKPTGWKNKDYGKLVDGGYLYNRCHLIGHQLAGEDANKQNLITGTRYMNVEGMLPFENMVADYVKETNNHVMYRITPIFKGDNLVASGVQMEAYSVEDKGDGVCYNVYVYNNQPGITIDYATGDSWLSNEAPTNQNSQTDNKNNTTQNNTANSNKNNSNTTSSNKNNSQEYILNINSKKFHKTTCSGAKNIKDSNKQVYKGDRQTLINEGYEPCNICKP